MRFVRALAAVLVVTAAAHGAPEFPEDIAGAAADWTSVADAAIPSADATKWKRGEAGVTATNPDAAWSVLELGTETYGDCAIRARVKTSAPCGIRVQAGTNVVATLIQEGTHLLRGAHAVGSNSTVKMSEHRKETDLVLVRRASRVEVWIDGARVLVGRDVPGDAKPGVGIWQGTATFSEVRVRRFPAPGSLPGEDGKPIVSTSIPKSVPLDVEGEYVHSATRLAFPEDAAGLTRCAVRRFDREGHNVQISFALIQRSLLLVASVYAFPAALEPDGSIQPLRQQFEQEVKDVLGGNTAVVERSVTESASECGGRAVTLFTKEFELEVGKTPGQPRSVSWLTSFRMGPWHVKYRLSGPLEERDAALAKFEQFLAELALPPTGIAAKPR